MSMDLLASVKEFLSENLIGSIAAKTDEADISVKQTLNTLVPVCGVAIAGKSSSDALNLVQYAHNNNVLDHVIRIANSTGDWKAKAEFMVNSAFGDSSHGIIKALADNSGLKETSVSKLLNLMLPIIAGIIGKQARDKKMNMHDLAAFFAENVSSWKSLIPATLGIEGILLSPPQPAKAPVPENVPEPEIRVLEPKIISMVEQVKPKTEEVKENIVPPVTPPASDEPFVFNLNETKKKKRGLGWLIALLVIGLLGAGAWWLWKNYQDNKSVTPVNEEVKIPLIDSGKLNDSLKKIIPIVKGKYDSAAGIYIYDIGEVAEIELPNNTGKIKVGKNSSEKLLIDLLSQNKNGSKDWFRFDRVFFKPAYFDVTNESFAQIKNFALIMKAFPKAVIKIGGYTDNSGDPVANKLLSTNRAKMLAGRLVAEGITASRIQFEGYGQEFPLCPENNSAECRAKNRRVDFMIVSN